MEIYKKKINEVLIIGVKGRLDALTSTDFEEALCTLINDGEKKLYLTLETWNIFPVRGCVPFFFQLSASKL